MSKEVKEMKAFEDYVKVKNVNLSSEGDEPYLVRLRMDDTTFAHIEVRPSGEGVYVLSVYQIQPDNERKIVKWVPGLISN